MYIINANGKVVSIDVSKFLNDEEFYSYIWKIQYNVEFSKNKQNIIGYVTKKESM